MSATIFVSLVCLALIPMSAGGIATRTPEESGNGGALTLDEVSFKRGSRAFGPFSIRVRSGEVVGLLGPNGAGKSSLLRVIEGALKARTGVVRVCGSDITALSRSDRQEAGVFVCLHDSRRLRANRSMLQVVGGAVSRGPRVLVLDEPFNGLQGLLPKQTMMGVLKACRDAGTAVLFTDHDVRAALEIADRAYLVHGGKIMYEGNSDELLGHQTLEGAL